MEIVTPLGDVIPPIVSVMGTAGPGFTDWGTTAVTCWTPGALATIWAVRKSGTLSEVFVLEKRAQRIPEYRQMEIDGLPDNLQIDMTVVVH